MTFRRRYLSGSLSAGGNRKNYQSDVTNEPARTFCKVWVHSVPANSHKVTKGRSAVRTGNRIARLEPLDTFLYPWSSAQYPGRCTL